MVKKTIFLHLKKRLKLFCIINVFFMIPFSSFGTNSISWNSEEDLFSVQYENVTVKDILDYIEKHSKYIFIYSANVQKNLNNKVSISVSNKKIDVVLKELFSETGLSYKVSGRQITISVPEAPITGIIGVLLIQIILGYFFWNSNELFVNVPLMLFGYSLVVGKKGNQDLLLFVQKQDLKKLLGKNINFVYLGTVTDSNLGIVGEEIGDEQSVKKSCFSRSN